MMKRKLNFIILFLVIAFSIFGAGTGELKVTVNLYPVGGTKKYEINSKTVLDTGIYNSQDTNIHNQVIARVEVIMEAIKKPGEDLQGNDPCSIDGNFNGILEYRRLKAAVEQTSIPLIITQYNGGSNVKMNLKSSNFREEEAVIIKEDSSFNFYIFTAYPDECGYKNMITRLKYSFDLSLDIENISNGDILGGTMNVQGDSGKGALKELILAQIAAIQTKR